MVEDRHCSTVHSALEMVMGWRECVAWCDYDWHNLQGFVTVITHAVTAAA